MDDLMLSDLQKMFIIAGMVEGRDYTVTSDGGLQIDVRGRWLLDGFLQSHTMRRTFREWQVKVSGTYTP